MNEHNRQTILNVLNQLSDIYTEDSTAILAADVNNQHTGNPPAVFVALVAKLVNLDR